MNFLIFSAQYLPHMGGIENFTRNLASKLIENNHKVVIVTSNTTNSPYYENVEGVDVYRFDCINLIDGRFPILKKNEKFKEILNSLNSVSFDFAIINARFYFHSVFGVKYASKRSIPHIVIDHGTSHLTVHNAFFDFMGGAFEHFLTRILKRYCSDFYGVSKASSQWLQHFHIDSKGEIYNAINLSDIEHIKNKPYVSIREQYHISNRSMCVSFTGRLLKEKGILQMVHAILRLNEEKIPVYCFIAGDGPLYEQLDAMKDSHIVLLGRLDFENVVHLLQETDVFCLASDSEGFSTSLLEAVACNNYIVTTARGGAREVILNDEYGIVIEENDEESVYKSLKRAILLKDKTEPTKLAYNNLVTNFTWDITARRVIELAKKKNEGNDG